MSNKSTQAIPHGNILIVDDNSSNLQSLSDILTVTGYQTETASSGELALQSVRNKQPELILLDYKMAGMNGIEVCQHIKSNPETEDIPVIFLSAHGDIDLKVKALETGGIDYVIKPIQPSELLAKIENHLKIYRLQRKLAVQSEELRKEVEERRLAEDNLKKSENFLSSIIDQTPFSTWIADSKGTSIRYNAACRKLFSITSDDQVIGKYNLFKDPILSKQGHLEEIEKVFSEGKTARFRIDYDFSFLESIDVPHPSHKILDATIFPIKDEEGNVSNAVIQHDDITEKKKMEEQLLHNEKLLTVAGLSGGISHELNTPLSAILQAHQLIKMSLSPEEPENIEKAAEYNIDLVMLQEYFKNNELDFFMDGIRESALQASHIVKSLQEFSHPQEGSFSTVNIGQLMDNALLFVQDDHDMEKKYGMSNIHIEKQYGVDLPSISCVDKEIEQVFISLIKNSVQALAETDSRENPYITLHLAVHNDRAVVEVEDNGAGIHKDIKKHIFDPFFTTKDPGAGTGLGLSVVHAIIVDKHKGDIQVESKTGQGTKFTIELPLQQDI